MEDESLADWSPILFPCWREETQDENDGQAKDNAHDGKDWTDQEHHTEK